MNTVKVLAGTLVGIAAGAALGVLFAPEDGKSTRKKISKGSSEYVDGLTNKFNAFVETMTQKFETLAADTASMAENKKEQAQNFVHDAANSVNKKVKEYNI